MLLHRACAGVGAALLLVGVLVREWGRPQPTQNRQPPVTTLVGSSGRGGVIVPTDGGFPWIVPVLFGVALLLLAAVAAARLRWARRVLHEHPWVVADAQVVEAMRTSVRSTRAERVLRLSGAPDDTPVIAASVGLRAPTLAEFAPQAWVAGDGPQFLVAAPGGAPILRVRRLQEVRS